MPKISAHAGFNNTKANSIESIKEAVRLNVSLLELDLRILKEDIVAVSHNEIAANETPVLLEAALDVLKNTNISINCDAKDPKVIKPTLKLLKKYNKQNQYFFTGSCDISSVEQPNFNFFINTESPIIFGNFNSMGKKEAEELRDMFLKSQNKCFKGYNIKYTCITNDAVKVFESSGIPVICWTVDKPADLDYFFSTELYAITTNNVNYANTLI